MHTQKLTLTLMIFLSFQTAHAGFLEWANKAFGFKSQQNFCAEVPSALSIKNPNLYIEKGLKQLRQDVNPCGAHHIFFEILRQYPLHPQRKAVWIYLIESLYKAGDFTLAINEANEFTKQHRATLEEEQAYYWIIKSVAAQFLNAKQSQTWVQMALGVHPDQSSQSTNFKNLEFKTFLEKFPQSKYFLEVQKLQQKAHHLLADHYLQVGLYYFQQKQWKAATGRFMTIIKTSAESPSFEPAVHYAILSFRQIAKNIRERKYSPARMRELMELDHEAPLDYELLAVQAESSAQTLRNVLQEKRPHSPWLTQL